jgi:hypothetical protein
MIYAGTHKSLGNPAAYASHAEYDDTDACKALHGFGSKEQLGTALPLLSFDCFHATKIVFLSL